MTQYSVQLLKQQPKVEPLGVGYSLRILVEDGKEIVGITNENGEVFFDAMLVKGKNIRFEFWGKEYPKGVVPMTDAKKWDSNKTRASIKVPVVCEVELKESENKNNEPEKYKQAYYLVKQGDTWSSIQKKLEIDFKDIILLQFENQLPLDNNTPPPLGKKLKYYMGMKRIKEKGNTGMEYLRSCHTGHPEVILSKDNEIEFDWFETPLVKLIISKESKGSFNAYNITGWDDNGKNKVYESHFEPTQQYHIEKMTIKEIRNAQNNYIGRNRKHLFAVGIFQITPKTLFGEKSLMKWINKYSKVDENTQLFNKTFQKVTPLFFWEEKRPIISEYFRGRVSVTEAAYEVAKEWASAAVPKGFRVQKKKSENLARISDGNISFYDSDGLNKAHYSADVTIKVLEETKLLIDANGGYEAIREHTLSKFNKKENYD